jgi:hypothetical protein
MKTVSNLPENINKFVPVPKPDAKEIVSLEKSVGKVTGYTLSDGTTLSKEEGVELAKQGGIKNVAISSRGGIEYLRTLPDGGEDNNLGNLPSKSLH